MTYEFCCMLPECAPSTARVYAAVRCYRGGNPPSRSTCAPPDRIADAGSVAREGRGRESSALGGVPYKVWPLVPGRRDVFLQVVVVVAAGGRGWFCDKDSVGLSVLALKLRGGSRKDRVRG